MENEPTINGRTLVALMALGLAIVLVLVSLVATASQLPPRIASHFNAAGVPDGWMDRGAYLMFMALFPAGMALLLVGTFYCVRYFPPSMINLPDRDYWLEPSRREYTFATLFRFGVWLASMQLVLMVAVHLLVVQANRTQPAKLSSAIWLLLAAFLVSTGVWSYFLIRQFRRPAN